MPIIPALKLDEQFPIEQTVFRPTDAAKVLQIDADSVNYHLAERPKLFPAPAKIGKRKRLHEWTFNEFERVCMTILNLSAKARAAVLAATATPTLAPAV